MRAFSGDPNEILLTSWIGHFELDELEKIKEYEWLLLE